MGFSGCKGGKKAWILKTFYRNSDKHRSSINPVKIRPYWQVTSSYIAWSSSMMANETQMNCLLFGISGSRHVVKITDRTKQKPSVTINAKGPIVMKSAVKTPSGIKNSSPAMCVFFPQGPIALNVAVLTLNFAAHPRGPAAESPHQPNIDYYHSILSYR